MSSTSIDRILLGSALVAALASFGWFGAIRHQNRLPVARSEPAEAYQPVTLAAPTVNAAKWPSPRPQTRGSEWVYDVFTPPEIGYDDRTREFTVVLPRDASGPDNSARPTAPVLLAVEREPFRLQLIGYVGEEGRYLGAFENLATSEVILGGTGREFPSLNLVITGFSLRRPLERAADGIGSRPWIATAVVRDQRTGGDITLRQGERTWTNDLRAVLAEDPDEEESIVELRPGEEFQTSDETYRVDRLQLEPPVAELTQISTQASEPIRLSLTASDDSDAGADRLSAIHDDD